MPITRSDLSYLQGLSQRLSCSALSLVELAIALQLILNLAILVAKGGGMKKLPPSLQNIRGYLRGMSDCMNELSSTMANSPSPQEGATNLPQYGVVQAAARPTKEQKS